MVANVKDGSTSSTSATQELKKGPWKPEEDMLLIEYVKKHGERDWNTVRKHSGLARCGKSCRLRWNNHLRPNLRKGPFSPDEEKLICELHSKIGNKWARIAAMLPGRTDNEIKNFWNTRVKRLARKGAPLYPSGQPRPDVLHNPYLQYHIEGQIKPFSPSTPSTSNFQSTTQISPTTSHSLLFPPPTQPQQFSRYDDVLQNSMALYDAALENSRQQQMFASATRNDDTMISSLHRFKRHRSVPNLTISVPPVRQVTLHPFSPLGISSVSMASTPTTPQSSYMQVATPMPSPHYSYTSSPTTSMVVSPTALQLGIPVSTSQQQPSFRLPVSSSPDLVMNNIRPTCLPRTTSFSFDHVHFDLNPITFEEQMPGIEISNDNELALFSVGRKLNGINNDDEAGGGAAGPLDEFLKEEEEEMKYEGAAKAFLNELDTDYWNESKLNMGQAEAAGISMELQDHELSNLLGSSEGLIWDNDNDNDNNNGQLNHYVDGGHNMGMEIMQHQLPSSVPVAAPSSWDNNIMPGVY